MKKAIELLKIKLEEKLRGKVRNFYIGDPWVLPTSNLPAILISPLRTETNIIDNQRDSHVYSINISLVIDARQYFDATPEKMVGTIFLMNTMEGEQTDGLIEPTTILGILRDNLNLTSNRIIQNVSTIDYTTRRRTEELITLEAVANLQIEYLVNR